MPRGVSTDLDNFKETLEKGVILVGGEVVNNNSIDPDDDTPVSVAIFVNVTGYGPHVGAISAVQGHVDAALQSAHGILEDWEMDHNPDYFKELEAEHGEDASDFFTETFDGFMWELPVEDFVAAIEGTEAEKYINVVEYEEEPLEEAGVSEIRSYGPGKFNTIIDGYAYDVTMDGADEEASYGEGNGWYGLLKLDKSARDHVRQQAHYAEDELTAEEEDLLDDSVAIIFFERSDGIVEADWFDDMAKVNEQWAAIEADTAGDDEEGDPEDDEEEEEVG